MITCISDYLIVAHIVAVIVAMILICLADDNNLPI